MSVGLSGPASLVVKEVKEFAEEYYSSSLYGPNLHLFRNPQIEGNLEKIQDLILENPYIEVLPDDSPFLGVREVESLEIYREYGFKKLKHIDAKVHILGISQTNYAHLADGRKPLTERRVEKVESEHEGRGFLGWLGFIFCLQCLGCCCVACCEAIKEIDPEDVAECCVGCATCCCEICQALDD